MANATRGELAAALFAALGLKAPTSTGRFTDSGNLDGITSTLFDLGITKGVAPDQFGTTKETTRGEAFTMIARALGLAGPNDSIATASQKLVDAGIVKGYGNDPSNIGINDPLQANHLTLLMGRLGPELARERDDGTTVGESILNRADEARQTEMASENPSFAAYLANLGVRRSEIGDEVNMRKALFLEDQKRRSEHYANMTTEAMKGIATDFENRGLTRSGTRLQREADRRTQIGRQQDDAAYAATRAHEEEMRRLEQARAELDRELAQRKADAAAEAAGRGLV